MVGGKVVDNLYIPATKWLQSTLNWVALSDKSQTLIVSKYIEKIVQFFKNKTLLTLFLSYRLLRNLYIVITPA